MLKTDKQQYDGYTLERKVAAIYRTLGAKVEHDIGIAGNQIDVFVKEKDKLNNTVKVAIECKAYTKPVGLEIVNSFAAVSFLLKSKGLIDKARMVSLVGFTKPAREAGKAHEIELLEINDILALVHGQEKNVQQAEKDIEESYFKTTKDKHKPSRLFAVMPFKKNFDDVFILGIQDVAEKLGMIAVRADIIEHNNGILEAIQKEIRSCKVVVADTTGQNPNVFYEIGYSHALETPTILITQQLETIPFDLRGVNHIVYDRIVDLKEKLYKRLKVTLENK